MKEWVEDITRVQPLGAAAGKVFTMRYRYDT
jgi:hypothetical protein